MAKDDDGDWKLCVRAILSSSQTAFSNSNIPSLVTLITKRYELGAFFFAVGVCCTLTRSFSLAGLRAGLFAFSYFICLHCVEIATEANNYW